MSDASDLLTKLSTSRTNRRRFINHVGLAGFGALAAGQLTTAFAQDGGPVINDVNILNFALNLEYLEAEFYLRAVNAGGLNAEDRTGNGPVGDVIGGRGVPFESKLTREYAEEIAGDEAAHVVFLGQALGANKVSRPQIDLAGSFTAAALAAGVIGPGEKFDPFASETAFLIGAFIFEDVGVTAYKGAARFIENKDVLEAAAGILAAEAYHASEVRTLLLGRAQSAPSIIDVVQKISDLRDAADGPGDLDQGIVDELGRANIVPLDNNGIAFSRTTRQVLNIVYLGGESAGGFFPQGLNGAIR